MAVKATTPVEKNLDPRFYLQTRIIFYFMSNREGPEEYERISKMVGEKQLAESCEIILIFQEKNSQLFSSQ